VNQIIIRLGCIVFCLFLSIHVKVSAQFGNYSSFQGLQTIELDTTFSIHPGALLRFPGIPIHKPSITQVSFFQLMGIKDWKQLSLLAKRQIESTAVLLAISMEKRPAVTTSQYTIQASKLLGKNYSLGVQLGILHKQLRAYKPVVIPIAQVGGWTMFSPVINYALSIGFSTQEVAAGWNQPPFVLLLRNAISWQLSPTTSLLLQVEKTTDQPVYWQGGISMKAGTSMTITFAYSANPQWWYLHFQFPIKKADIKISLGLQPLLGTQSGLTTLLHS